MPPKSTKGKEVKTVINLNKYLNKYIRVKFNGGREVRGLLKGFDVMSNLVLDEAEEFKCESESFYSFDEESRPLGLVVARGTSVALIFSDDGTVPIDNPFIES
ncbi:U6 snRNA-associated Sm-like protein LSm7 [Babesia microti strain RI]|uniref:U6 snRNA-associated Sm-like protein LSm7 n=1 Tax=Babesia microti (strain RI) TaxID=1133968 RepID=I7IG99_BABMR|nr:U6 snRNA-associated Sm-like protein LSm7 [Babesia microti strain RI]CCF73491.1 U6 snRNA-associated Sm-like protein LSm7 [Babesia microti strain RI]|eukprot:XP_012648100.1 U6 snRNA-associated Sm-like protein LSm7 [Babesia microti strain RI]